MSDEIKNPTRIEQYLSKAAGEDTDLPDAPMTRIEQYLAKIAGQDVELPDETYTRIEEYLKTIAENGGGGGDVTLETLNVNSNGTTNAPSGTAYNKVVANVPNSYAAGDEGKVVSNGALVSQTAHAQVTENGPIDTTLNNSVEVAVPAPSGTKQINITQNGTTTENVADYASAEISVSVSGGGGLTTVVDYTVSEDVSEILIDSGLGNYDHYVISFSGNTSAAEWIYPKFVSTDTSRGQYINVSGGSVGSSTWDGVIFTVDRAISGDDSVYVTILHRGPNVELVSAGQSFSYLRLLLYYGTSKFQTGFRVLIKGGNLS